MEPESNPPAQSATPWRGLISRRLLLFIALAIVALIAATIWPTAYRYDKMAVGQNTFLVRINRFTGFTEIFRGTRWVPEAGSARPVATDPLPADQLAKITGNARVNSWNTFSGDIYNGSAWIVRELTVNITVKKKMSSAKADDQVLWSRQFRIPNLYIPPLEARSFSINVAGAEEVGETAWTILSARGHR